MAYWLILILLSAWLAVGGVYGANVAFKVHRPLKMWEVVLCMPAAILLTVVDWIAKKFGYELETKD